MAVCWEQEQPDGKAVTSSTSEVVSEITLNPEVMQIQPAPEESGSQETGPIRVISGGRFNSDAVIDGPAQSLLAAQIPLSGLHTNMSQEELNLFKLSTGGMAQPGASAPEVMRSQLLDAHPSSKLFDNAPHDLFCDTCAPD